MIGPSDIRVPGVNVGPCTRCAGYDYAYTISRLYKKNNKVFVYLIPDKQRD